MKFEYMELQSRMGRGHKVYQFDGIDYDSGLIDALNTIGGYGWELCGEIGHTIVMKRLITEQKTFTEDNMKIQLYTCRYGIALFKEGSQFGAWNENSRSFGATEENFKILVDEKDIKKVKNEDGAYSIMRTESVEIVE